jgi:hypothetical protein
MRAAKAAAVSNLTFTKTENQKPKERHDTAMKTKLITLAALAGSLLLASTAVAQDTTTPRDAVVTTDHELDPELRELINEFREQRRDVLDLLRTLRERLANATEEERRAIIAEFRAEVRERNQAERELRKELRRRRHEIIRERRAAAAGSGE